MSCQHSNMLIAVHCLAWQSAVRVSHLCPLLHLLVGLYYKLHSRGTAGLECNSTPLQAGVPSACQHSMLWHLYQYTCHESQGLTSELPCKKEVATIAAVVAAALLDTRRSGQLRQLGTTELQLDYDLDSATAGHDRAFFHSPLSPPNCRANCLSAIVCQMLIVGRNQVTLSICGPLTSTTLPGSDCRLPLHCTLYSMAACACC